MKKWWPLVASATAHLLAAAFLALFSLGTTRELPHVPHPSSPRRPMSPSQSDELCPMRTQDAVGGLTLRLMAQASIRNGRCARSGPALRTSQ